MSKLKIGWAEVDITPDKKVSLAGQFAERISEYVEKPLTATAMAVDSGCDQMVVCSTDLVGVSFNLVSAVRERLAGNSVGLDPEKVILAAIHTHTAPCYPRTQRQAAGGLSNSARYILESLLPAGKKYVEAANVSHNSEIATDEEVFALLVDRISSVILDAWNARAAGWLLQRVRPRRRRHGAAGQSIATVPPRCGATPIRLSLLSWRAAMIPGLSFSTSITRRKS